MIELIGVNIDLTTTGIMLPIGAIIGYMSHFLLSKAVVSMEKRLSIVFITIWVIFITISFFTGQDVPNLFDFIGFGASGTLLGIDMIKKFENVKNAVKK